MELAENRISELLLSIVSDYRQNTEQLKNCLIWNGDNLLFPICEILGNEAKCKSLEFSSESFSYLNKEISEENTAINSAKYSLAYIPRDSDTGDETTDYRSYSLHPATYPIRYELIVINGKAKSACARYARNMMSAESIIAITNSEQVIGKLPKDLFTAEFINILSGEKMTLLSAERDLFLHLCLRAQSKYSNIFRLQLNFEYKLSEEGKLSKTPSILFIHSYDKQYLSGQYSELLLNSMTYEEQKSYLLSKLTNKSDFYSFQMKQLGCRVDNLIVNCLELQHSWALERDSVYTLEEIIHQQIIDFSPEIIFIDDVSLYEYETIANFKRKCKIIVGEVFKAPFHYDVLAEFDLIIGANIDILNPLSEIGVPIFQIPFLFDNRVAEFPSNFSNRKYPISVIVNNDDEDYEFAKQLSSQLDVSIFSISYTPADDRLKSLANYLGNAVSYNLYKLMSNSKIVMCRDWKKLLMDNLEFSPILAGACGAVCICGYSKKIQNIMEIGEEIICFRTIEEAINLAKYYYEYREEAIELAGKSRKRVIENYLYSGFSDLLLDKFSKIEIR